MFLEYDLAWAISSLLIRADLRKFMQQASSIVHAPPMPC
jgi:hypothetical protein